MDLTCLYGGITKKAIRSGEVHLDKQNGLGTIILCDEWEFFQPHCLEIAFQSYLPWCQEVAENGILCSTAQGLALHARSMDGERLEAQILADRVDWKFDPIQSLILQTGKTTRAIIETRLSFRL